MYTTPTGDYYDDTDEDDYEEDYSSENSTTNGKWIDSTVTIFL